MADVTKITEKMVSEAVGAQNADVQILLDNRGGDFKISDAQPYVDAVNEMEAIGDQSKEVFDLHVESVNAHFEILKELTDTIIPEDDPFVEHYQTPPILEVLFDEDPEFRAAMDKFVDALDDYEGLIGKESMRRYAGFYGPTAVVDFAFCPGATSNVINRILKDIDGISDHYKQAILASKSWGMNTSYGLGADFAEAIEAGKSPDEAVKKEIATLKEIYDTPVAGQTRLMEDVTSFDVAEYMEKYRKRMEPVVKRAMEAEVHYGNIVTVPAYCVGDIGHHIAQSTYNMVKDDVTMAIIEAVSEVMENTLNKGVEEGYDSVYDVLSVATGSTAAAVATLLEDEGFTSAMVVDLLTKRFTNYVQLNPTRGAAVELHNVDFMDMIHRGSKIIDVEPIGKGAKVKGIPVDLDPLSENEVLSNPQRYAYPACAFTVRFSSLMRLSDYPCLLTSEPVTATLMTNVIALNPERPASPARVCKDCATCQYIKKHQHCNWDDSV